jgi:hypothetical protein
VSVFSIRREDVVRRFDRGYGANRHRFFAIIEVEETADFSSRILARRLFLKTTDANHITIE